MTCSCLHHRTCIYSSVSSLYAYWSQITLQCVCSPVILRHVSSLRLRNVAKEGESKGEIIHNNEGSDRTLLKMQIRRQQWAFAQKKTNLHICLNSVRQMVCPKEWNTCIFIPSYFIVRYVCVLLKIREITVWNDSYNFFCKKCTHQHCVMVQKRRVKNIWRSSLQQ